jgi:hypothetical protein
VREKAAGSQSKSAASIRNAPRSKAEGGATKSRGLETRQCAISTRTQIQDARLNTMKEISSALLAMFPTLPKVAREPVTASTNSDSAAGIAALSLVLSACTLV